MFLQNNKKGFTLIELLSILGVLGIILLIAVPTYIGINKTVKEKMLETKLKIIEESAITFGESIKETIVNSSNLYKDNLPCKSISISSLVPKYLNKDNQNECITNGSESTIGCIVDPSNTEKYLDKEEVIIYYKNKRIYAVVDTDDTLECVTDVNSLEISTFYLGKDNPNYTITKNIDAYISWDNQNVEYYCVTNIPWFVDVYGNVARTPYDDFKQSIRPVFYLNSSVIRVSGSGTSTDPFIID